MYINRKVLPLANTFLIGVSLLLTGCDDKSANKGAQQPPEVDVITVKSVPMQVTTELPGRTSPLRIAEVRPQVSGIILKRNFTEGSNVKAGDSLYQIDPAPYQAAYASAKGNLAQANAAANIARLTVKRYSPLLSTNSISKQDYDQAVAKEKQALATVQAAEAQVEAARINLAYTKVLAPISGRIGKSLVTEGALALNAQANPMAVIQQLDPIYVDLTQSSEAFLQLRTEFESGQLSGSQQQPKVTLKLNDGGPYRYSGSFQFSDVTVNESTSSITLRAIFPNPENHLLPGMFVRAVLEEGINPHAILVPQQAVARTPTGEATVILVNAENKAETRTIVTNKAYKDKWLVKKGLQAGDRIVVSGFQRIKPGATVQPRDVTANDKPAN